MPDTTPSVTIRIFRWPKPERISPRRRLDPAPTSSVGCGIGNSPVTTPAARIAVDSPTERTTSPNKFDITIRFLAANLHCGAYTLFQTGAAGRCFPPASSVLNCNGE
jgi:hypothetical protein